LLSKSRGSGMIINSSLIFESQRFEIAFRRIFLSESQRSEVTVGSRFTSKSEYFEIAVSMWFVLFIRNIRAVVA
jgi:hypothetical protein